jgi:hypothetical protein
MDSCPRAYHHSREGANPKKKIKERYEYRLTFDCFFLEMDTRLPSRLTLASKRAFRGYDDRH